jgi:hypothetical protein
MTSPCFVPGFYATSAVAAYGAVAAGGGVGGAETAELATPALAKSPWAIRGGVVATVSGAKAWLTGLFTSTVNKVC